MYYEIREKWKIAGSYEFYFNIRQNLKEVRKFIEDWIESWVENANEVNSFVKDIKTDFRTFASCKIGDVDSDSFYLKVIKKHGKKRNVTGLSLTKFDEEI